MPIVGGLDIHRKQLTFDYLDTVTGEVKRGQVAPADRVHLRACGVPELGHCGDLGFYAARSYSLRRPPRTGRRLTRTWERSATG